MIEPKNIEINGMKFQLKPLPALTALRLDKKVLSLFIPILGGVKEASLDADIDMEAVSKGLFTVFESLDDATFERLVLDLTFGAVHLGTAKNPVSPESLEKQVIDRVFMGELHALYKLLFEIMKFNKFSPFVLVGEGGYIVNKIVSLVEQKVKTSESGKESAKSGKLLED